MKLVILAALALALLAVPAVAQTEPPAVQLTSLGQVVAVPFDGAPAFGALALGVYIPALGDWQDYLRFTVLVRDAGPADAVGSRPIYPALSAFASLDGEGRFPVGLGVGKTGASWTAFGFVGISFGLGG